MEAYHGDIYQYRGCDTLEHTDHKGLLSGFLQRFQTEFGADGEGDEAHGDVGEQRQRLDVIIRREAQSGDTEAAQGAGTDQEPCSEEGGDVRKIPEVEYTGHEEARKECD